MKFQRIYIEITNVCNLTCSYCLSHTRDALFMSPKQFEQILTQIKSYTDHIYLHIKGEPLIHPDFIEFLNLADQYHLKVHLVSNGTLLDKLNQTLINHPALVQCTISLHNYDVLSNEDRTIYENKLDELFELVNTSHISLFLRIWDFKSKQTQTYIKQRFSLDIALIEERKRLKLTHNISLDLDHQFIWPDIKDPYNSNIGTCLAGTKMMVIYVNGDVGPCCLDTDTSIKLGNINIESLDEILRSPRYLTFIKGLRESKLTETLCQRCTYHNRFKRLDG